MLGQGTGYRGISERDLHGAKMVPGFIDAHVHIESSLLTPPEYARVVADHGTTTVIADPHEIANVAGARGIRFMLQGREGLPVDIRYMLPSCVPAMPLDVGGAVLGSRSLARFKNDPGVLGLGEMMNVPGVLNGDQEVLDKISLMEICDGHAPLLTGNDLNAYILAGPNSDHECTTRKEAEEKLRKGMYIFIREGSTEKNIEALVPLVTPATAPRCCFATDDCHADLLFRSGHIDRCIRSAMAAGLEPELALRMATLSAAERFRLSDRGALSPGRRADFCILEKDSPDICVKETFSRGVAVKDYKTPLVARPPLKFKGVLPSKEDIRLSGKGKARVIGLVPHQILTKSLSFDVDAVQIPDPDRDLLKVVVCNRYGKRRAGTGIVRGFGFTSGAIAASISHDTHNIVSVGTSDTEILSAIERVIRSQGGMSTVLGSESAVLPLDCAGLMSTRRVEDVIRRLDDLSALTQKMGGISDPFMYLSFLALTVIPQLRITDRGLFDFAEFRDVPLFFN